MIWLLAIPACAILYRARGAGWPKAWFGVDDRGIVKAVCLALLAWAMVLPMAVRSPVPLWEVLVLSAAVIAAFFTGRAGHGEFYHDGMQAPPRDRARNGWLAIYYPIHEPVFGWTLAQRPLFTGQERSPWKDRIGLGLTGLLMTVPAAIASTVIGQWGYALALASAGLIGKPAAYAIGWRLTGGQTLHGEWLFGAFIGVAVAIGFMVVQW